jgi:hypothetical protein
MKSWTDRYLNAYSSRATASTTDTGLYGFCSNKLPVGISSFVGGRKPVVIMILIGGHRPRTAAANLRPSIVPGILISVIMSLTSLRLSRTAIASSASWTEIIE